MANTNYAIYVNGQCIYGVGTSLEEAAADAANWMDDMDVEDILEKVDENEEYPNEPDLLQATPCTDELFNYIRDEGDNTLFYMRTDGVLDLIEE